MVFSQSIVPACRQTGVRIRDGVTDFYILSKLYLGGGETDFL